MLKRNKETKQTVPNLKIEKKTHNQLQFDIVLHTFTSDALDKAYREACATGSIEDNRARMNLIGYYGAGKTSLGEKLTGQEFDEKTESTEGIATHRIKSSFNKKEGTTDNWNETIPNPDENLDRFNEFMLSSHDYQPHSGIKSETTEDVERTLKKIQISNTATQEGGNEVNAYGVKTISSHNSEENWIRVQRRKRKKNRTKEQMNAENKKTLHRSEAPGQDWTPSDKSRDEGVSTLEERKRSDVGEISSGVDLCRFKHLGKDKNEMPFTQENNKISQDEQSETKQRQHPTSLAQQSQLHAQVLGRDEKKSDEGNKTRAGAREHSHNSTCRTNTSITDDNPNNILKKEGPLGMRSTLTESTGKRNNSNGLDIKKRSEIELPVQMNKIQIDMKTRKQLMFHKKTPIKSSRDSVPYTINLWDSGGQDEFFVTHHLFIDVEATTLIVMDITKELRKPLGTTLKESTKMGIPRTPLEFLFYWLNAIHIKSTEKQVEPNIALVFTHKDMIQAEDAEQYVEAYIRDVLSSIEHKPYSEYVSRNNIFVVDNKHGDQLEFNVVF